MSHHSVQKLMNLVGALYTIKWNLKNHVLDINRAYVHVVV